LLYETENKLNWNQSMSAEYEGLTLWTNIITNLILLQFYSVPAHVVQWLDHLGIMCSRAWRAQSATGPELNPSCSPVRRVRLRKK